MGEYTADVDYLPADLRAALDRAYETDTWCRDAMDDPFFAKLAAATRLTLIEMAVASGDWYPLRVAADALADAEFRAWATQRDVCSACGGIGVHLAWGRVSGAVGELINQGALVGSGCLRSESSPDWECLACHLRWGRSSVAEAGSPPAMAAGVPHGLVGDVFVALRHEVPDVFIQRLEVTHPADDSNVWFISLSPGGQEVQVDTWPGGGAPFVVEGSGEGLRVETSDIDVAVRTILAWL